jgi:hypothetical protein
MKGRSIFRVLVASAIVVAVSTAASPTIGIATAVGVLFVNGSTVEGNANLSEGSQVRTGKASSQVFLQNGATLTLGMDSAAALYKDHVVLEQGATKVDNMNAFHVVAKDYRIEQQAPGAQAVVRLNGDLVEIGALAGSLSVFDRKGALLTHIGTGIGASFQADDGNGRRNGNNGRNGTTNPNVNTRIRYTTAASIMLAVSLAGLGLAVDAILQPGPTSR